VILDTYRIERSAARGGMGIILEATHLALGRSVAIKVLSPAAMEDPEYVQRFLREGRAATRIKSEHVARVFDAGTLATGLPYIVMEYLDGRDLRSCLDEHGPFATEVAVDYVLQACEALAEAHAAGIVHRDLKPENLFLTHRADQSPCIKVLDFGISKIDNVCILPRSDDVMRLTDPSVVLGSPRYMPPEQMRSSGAVDARADIWAIGVILHQLLTNVEPFEGESIAEVWTAVLHDEPIRLRDVREDVPPGLEDVVLRCLEKNPDRRYQNVAELATALAPFASEQGKSSARRAAKILELAGKLHTPKSTARSPVFVMVKRRRRQRSAPWVFMWALTLIASSLIGTAVREARREGPGPLQRTTTAVKIAPDMVERATARPRTPNPLSVADQETPPAAAGTADRR
jgi:serine/threonine-protein kinase